MYWIIYSLYADYGFTAISTASYFTTIFVTFDYCNLLGMLNMYWGKLI